MSLNSLLGNLAVVFSMGTSLIGIILFFLARRLESNDLLAWGRRMVYANFWLYLFAIVVMLLALLTNDFSVSYVAHVGSRDIPRWVSAVSLWSSLEGSILLWGFVLASYGAASLFGLRKTASNLIPWAGIAVLFVQLFFALLLALPANPFLPVLPAPLDGPGPNPLLQNHWLMTIHPPALYLGYIGMTIPFAFAIAALMERDASALWIRLCKRPTLFAWSFLSIAIVLGGWWSYEVLGWGGYWAWDPVENASFMPWLSATAMIHAFMIQERRNSLSLWNLVLAVITFLLTIIGTFLTRSGILESVHSFSESHIGPYFLIFIAALLTISILLLMWRTPTGKTLRSTVEKLFSLDVMLLINNLLLITLCFIVFLGTFYPLIVELLRGQRVSIGEPYFDQMSIPIFLALILLLLVSMIVPRNKHASNKVMLWRLLSTSPRHASGFIAHVGFLIMAVAVAVSHIYDREDELTFTKGEWKTFGGYELKLQDIVSFETPQRYEVRAQMNIRKQGKDLGTLIPQLNFYPNSREPIGSPAVRSSFVEDFYLSPIQFGDDGKQASLRVMVNPAVIWIWIGAGLVFGGGLMATAFYRRKEER
ncbi:MAG: heme lyase CcmF/NrfE family subunit [Deltaproteobacteria bacterium]|nr:heme lyase CcmF/NrfE family subunit [Deltaproteobacteria bacterium]